MASTDAPGDQPLLKVANRGLLMAAVLTVAVTQYLDATITNVALPHMQASLNASPESVTWVVTSFIVAGAIGTPIVGWLNEHVGSRRLFLLSAAVFLVSSAACGASQTLTEMVLFRFIQGLSAAIFGPMTQTVLYDINPPSKQAGTAAIFAMSAMVAPIAGPFVGGYITEYLDWRWVFYVNLPIGIPALVVLWWILPDRPTNPQPFDGFGFFTIALALAAMQLLLDRGQTNDWFDSTESVVEAALMAAALWAFAVHTWFARNPLFPRELLADRSFMASCLTMILIGVANVAVSAVLPLLFLNVFRYPVTFVGVLMAPRGVGVIITTLLNMRLTRLVDERALIGFGFSLVAVSLWMMSGWTLAMGWEPLVLATFIQGLGLGLTFTPIVVLTFGPLSTEMRPHGAALVTLFRNIGGSVGVSAMVVMLFRVQQTAHSNLAAHVTPMTDLSGLFGGRFGDAVLPALDGVIGQQAAMIAYLANFKLLAVLMFAMAFVPPLLMRNDARKKRGETIHVAME